MSFSYEQITILECFSMFSQPQNASFYRPKWQINFPTFSYTVFPRVITGGDYWLFASKESDYSLEGNNIILRRWLFQIFLTGSSALNILLYFPIKSKKLSLQINWTWAFSVPNLVPSLIFSAWTITDQFCWIRFHFNLTGRPG